MPATSSAAIEASASEPTRIATSEGGITGAS